MESRTVSRTLPCLPGPRLGWLGRSLQHTPAVRSPELEVAGQPPNEEPRSVYVGADRVLRETRRAGGTFEPVQFVGGQSVRAYRSGGRGRENVLTAEVLWPLSCLPREAFLGEVLRRAHGAEEARSRAAGRLEEAAVTLLPDNIELAPDRLVVQPDATVVSPTTYTLIEAKRIRRSSFQVRQLARELVALFATGGDRPPLLLLLLGSPPPVVVAGQGHLSIERAIAESLADVLAATPEVDLALDDLMGRLDATIAWITWAEVADITSRQAELFRETPNGLAGTVRRLASAVSDASTGTADPRRPAPASYRGLSDAARCYRIC